MSREEVEKILGEGTPKGESRVEYDGIYMCYREGDASKQTVAGFVCTQNEQAVTPRKIAFGATKEEVLKAYGDKPSFEQSRTDGEVVSYYYNLATNSMISDADLRSLTTSDELKQIIVCSFFFQDSGKLDSFEALDALLYCSYQ